MVLCCLCYIVSCIASVFIELVDAHFFTHNDLVETTFRFIKKKKKKILRMAVLPLQWFSFLVTWFEIFELLDAHFITLNDCLFSFHRKWWWSWGVPLMAIGPGERRE